MKLTDAEWKLMKIIWQKNPASARDVLEQLEGQTHWAYTTIKTMLSRLVEKGVLSARMRANTVLYEPLLTQTEARRSALFSILNTAFDGAFGPLMHFMLAEEKLSVQDRKELLSMLKEQEKRRDKR